VKRLIVPAAASFLAFLALLALGFWQLDRKVWKEALIAKIETGLQAAPLALWPENEWTLWNPQTHEFRKIEVSGTFLHDKEILVHGLYQHNDQASVLKGFYVFTPLQLEKGGIVIMNRGFVPDAVKEPQKRAQSQAAGIVTLIGLLRASETRTMFVPENQPLREEWFVRSIPDMAAARGLMRVAPFLIELDATAQPDGWPKGGRAVVNIRNNHLSYALTWFSLAAILLVIFGVFAYQRTKTP
jgi:surfeit locus 1 family protein